MENESQLNNPNWNGNGNDKKTEPELIKKSVTIDVHIDFTKEVEKELDWSLEPKQYFTKDENKIGFSYENIVDTLEYSSIKEFETQLRGYFQNESIKVEHSQTNVGSISLILTIVNWFDNANKAFEFFENIGKVKKFASKFFKSDLTNQYGDYFKVDTKIIDDPNEHSFSDIINHFLWFCAGAKIKYIKHCPTDHVKYANIGLMVFLTAVLALLTSTYATYSITHSIKYAFSIGSFWGFLIFSIDRTIVSSIKPGEKGRILKMFIRFLLAITLALLISNPFEVLVFKNRINMELLSIAGENEKEYLTNNLYDTQEYKDLKKEIEFNKKERKVRTDMILRFNDSLDAEIKGFSKTQKPGYGIAAKEIRKTIGEKNVEKVEFDSLRKPLDEKLKTLEDKVKNEAKTYSDANKGKEDIIECNRALSKVIEKEPFSKYTYLLIFFALLLFELSPLIVKLTSSTGEYDKFFAALEKENSNFHIEEINKNMRYKILECKKLQINTLDSFEELKDKILSIKIDGERPSELTSHIKKQSLEITTTVMNFFKNAIGSK